MTDFEEKLNKMVHRVGLEPRNSYNISESAKIIGVSKTTLERMVDEYEVLDGDPKRGTLQGFFARARTRVSHDELLSFLQRGNEATFE